MHSPTITPGFQISGYKQFAVEVNRLGEDLRAHFDTLVKVAHWVPSALQLLKYIALFHSIDVRWVGVCAGSSRVCRPADSPPSPPFAAQVSYHTVFATAYLDVLSKVVALLLLLDRIQDRRALVACHNACHNALRGQPEPQLTV